MSGINSLSGLSKVSVDFQPTITTNVQNTGNANQPQPGADAVPEEAPQLGKAKSVVQQLDVLLVNAAGKSVSADAVKNVKKVDLPNELIFVLSSWKEENGSVIVTGCAVLF